MLLEGHDSLLSSSANTSVKETRDVGIQATSRCDQLQQCLWIAQLIREHCTINFNDLLSVSLPRW